MAQILLVEDEPMFRKGLAKMIAGLAAGWEVCGEAENGVEAEQLVEEMRPDLVITDIRMPLMDGLELLKRVKERHPDVAVIVITGFQDFQYAQSALRYGAMDLLVKPCSKQDICLALDKAAAVVAEKQERRCREQSERVERQDIVLRQMFLRLPCRPEAAASLGRELCGSRLILLQITDYFPAHKQYLKKDMPLLQFAVLNIVSELLEVHGMPGRFMIIEAGRFALFMTETEQQRETELCGAITATLRQLLGLRADCCEAATIRTPGQLADLYESLLGRPRGEAAERMNTQQDVNGQGMPPTGTVNRARQQLIAAQTAGFIQAGETEALKRYLAQQIDTICNSPGDEWKMEALSLGFALQETARRHLGAQYSPQAITSRIERLHECRGMAKVQDWLTEETDQFLEVLTDWQKKYGTRSVVTAIRYIEEHYAEPLNLAEVAAQAHLSAAYFSHLFKKETGRSFVTFLIEVRMEKAKQLLANTGLNVTEVSGIVGYDLPNYFAKLFKQYCGLTPKEYRRRQQN
ncbi:MAG: response regulator [Paenibacillaceae bacterium]|jgi:two-component system response regulator YesN|nr:response regulator [Paenibacillaceae bacterium]